MSLGDRIVILALDRVVPEFIARPLRPLGYRLTVVKDANELRSEVISEKPRAAFLPVRVPGDDLADLSASVKTAKDEPCAIIVYGLDDADRNLARNVGADGFLRVPFADSEVLEILGASTRARKLILLADDSPLIHAHTVPILEDAGYDVVSAVDGQDALDKVGSRRPDLVILDVEMPRLDGYQVCKQLKSHPATAHLPVLICSALGEAHDLERGFDAGADDYLVKPVIPEEMTTRVRHLLMSTMREKRPERILVVDDSPAQRHYVEDCLTRQGFEVVTAENGKIGLLRAHTATPNLIVSDYDMPEMNGFEMVLALRRDPTTRDVPVIMLTARDSRRDVAQMRAAGATAYLVKPFAQDKCIALVERTLAERRLYAYKQASRVYISDGAQRAAEDRADRGDLGSVRAEERVMAVLFSDICSFTQMSGKLTPREVILLLNDYFDVLCPIIKAEAGDIDKFIGDAIMAVFDEVPARDPAPLRAVRAALGMQAAMAGFNEGREVKLEMRIGVNTGPLVRGDLGSRFVRRDYTVIGDTVNRANRYESKAPHGGVLISQSTRDALGDLVDAEPVPGLTLKGVDEPVVGWVVKAVRVPSPLGGDV